MLYNRNTLTIIRNLNSSKVLINIYINLGNLVRMQGMLIQSIHKNLIKNLKQRRRIHNVLADKLGLVVIKNPRTLIVRFS